LQQTIIGVNSSEKLFQNKHDYLIDNVILDDKSDAENRYLKNPTKYRLRMLMVVSKALSEQYKNAIIQNNVIINEINAEFKD
jgi:hypothetical protein